MIFIDLNEGAFRKGLNDSRDATGFATVVALTRTAKATGGEFLPAEAARVFDRPTRWTLQGFYWRPATRDQRVMTIGVKDWAGKGTPASKFLRAQILGGGRAQKKSERALTLAGLMGNQGFWVPGPGIRLDAYGNVPGATIVQILADLKAYGEVGYTANRTARSTRRNKNYRKVRYFVPTPDKGLRPGVWMRKADGTIIPALLFIPTANYRMRLDFFGKGEAFARQRFPIEFEQALAEGFGQPKA